MMECWELRVALEMSLEMCHEERERQSYGSVRGIKKNHTPKQAVELPKVEEEEA